MPCRDYMDDHASHAYQVAEANKKCEILRKRLDNVTRLLCGVMHELEQEGVISAQHELVGLKEWWTEHQRLDALREQKERKAREEKQKKLAAKRAAERAKANALSKLTPEERKALGL